MEYPGQGPCIPFPSSPIFSTSFLPLLLHVNTTEGDSCWFLPQGLPKSWEVMSTWHSRKIRVTTVNCQCLRREGRMRYQRPHMGRSTSWEMVGSHACSTDLECGRGEPCQSWGWAPERQWVGDRGRLYTDSKTSTAKAHPQGHTGCSLEYSNLLGRSAPRQTACRVF